MLYKSTLSLMAIVLSSCNVSGPVTTCSLKDTLIAIAKEAKEAGGVEKFDYEATVTKTKEGSVAVVVPSTPSFNLGLKQTSANGSTIKMTVNVKDTASKPISGKKYILDRSTLEAHEAN